MKIIKNAMTTPVQITCPGCISLLEYTYEDIKRRDENTIFGFYAGTTRYIVCPVCKREIDISKVEENKNDQ